jgi:hypothetical protein
MRLVRCEPRGPRRHPIPVLIGSPLLAKPYVLDLAPRLSLVDHLVERGLELFLLDFGIPDSQDRQLRFEVGPGPARGGLECRSPSRDGFGRNARPCGRRGRTRGAGHHVAEADCMARDPLRSGPVESPRGREAASPRPAAPGAGRRMTAAWRQVLTAPNRWC